ncbi:MAG: heme ABC exporter, ATP-binding protein CcmA [Euryarchaeota archaeon RBG_19FT_COMBO_56_21]|nr:MAG: heme ABC exporter, ATP-binding protein CcmA [Euryarchaeota archaeon RBG_19FT_COMBO_56_21]
MIEAKGISKTFGRRTVLDKVDLVVGDGEIVALMGPNGAGKTTLLRILATLLEPSSGEVVIQSMRVLDDPVIARKAIGVIGHSPYVYDDLTALENLSFYWSMYGLPRGKSEEAGRAMLERVGLSHRMHDRAAVFSKGMRQRLAIARALLHSPKILLLDEPFSSLDQKGVDVLSQILLEEKAKGRSILVVTHDVQRISTLADRADVLIGGRVGRSYDSRAIGKGELDMGYRTSIERGIS